MRKGLVLNLAILLMVGALAFAGEKVEQKTFKGTLSCMGCDLKVGSGANAQCKVYGHDHALKLEDGSYISFMENDHSEKLIHAADGKWHGKKIEVTGDFFGNANVIDVKSFKTMDKSFSYCSGHKNMDQCHSMHGH